MFDLEGLEDLEPVVINAIRVGLNNPDPNIHPDRNNLSHPIPRSSVGNEVGWIERVKQKIASLQSKDGNIYPLF